MVCQLSFLFRLFAFVVLSPLLFSISIVLYTALCLSYSVVAVAESIVFCRLVCLQLCVLYLIVPGLVYSVIFLSLTVYFRLLYFFCIFSFDPLLNSCFISYLCLSFDHSISFAYLFCLTSFPSLVV